MAQVNNIRLALSAMPVIVRQISLLWFDIFCICLSVWLAFFVSTGEPISPIGSGAEIKPVRTVVLSGMFFLPLMVYSGQYNLGAPLSIFRSQSRLVVVHLVYLGLFFPVVSLYGVDGVPQTMGVLQPVVLLAFILGSRVLSGAYLTDPKSELSLTSGKKKILIYGAGVAGRELAAQLLNSRHLSAVGFLDDSSDLQGRLVSHLPVFSPENLKSLVSRMQIDQIMLAMPSVPRRRRYEIINSLRLVNLTVRTIPSYEELIRGTMTFKDVQDLTVDDILQRDPVKPDPALIRQDIFQKSVLVTGAGGSIGSELCRQILRQQPAKLIMIDQNEYALYVICEELKKLQEFESQITPTKLHSVLGSVTNTDFLERLFASVEPSTVFHAAAYKHVPIVEENCLEGFRNNVLGTLELVKMAASHNIEKFILVSTDKAVRPSSLMGATKRLAEMILQAFPSLECRTSFAVVRFGNVLDSSGSVVPLFRKQIAEGGPVTLTHPDVTRYFMTIAEAAQLVIQAAALTPNASSQRKPTPVFLLDMGRPVKIRALAERMIQLAGMTVFDPQISPHGEIEIKTIGLRAGEKLHEELLIGDSQRVTIHPKIHVADEEFVNWGQLSTEIERLTALLMFGNSDELRKALRQSVHTLLQLRELSDDPVELDSAVLSEVKH